jgi:hypothetical protein
MAAAQHQTKTTRKVRQPGCTFPGVPVLSFSQTRKDKKKIKTKKN